MSSVFVGGAIRHTPESEMTKGLDRVSIKGLGGSMTLSKDSKDWRSWLMRVTLLVAAWAESMQGALAIAHTPETSISAGSSLRNLIGTLVAMGCP